MKKKLSPADITAIIDTREQRPLTLGTLAVKRGTLYCGDYSVSGLQNFIAIERKSLQDLVMCCGAERERFEKEITRLLAYPVRALVVEASWTQLEIGPGLPGGWRGKMSSNAVQGSVLGWIAQGVPVLMAGNHETAGRLVANLLFIAARRRWEEGLVFLGAQAQRAQLASHTSHSGVVAPGTNPAVGLAET